MAMTDEEVLILLKKMAEENDDFEEKDITFFEIIDKCSKETLISRMLAYTLKRDVGLVGKFIEKAHKEKVSLNVDNIPFVNIVVTNIRCEKVLPGGRIDIFVEAMDDSGRDYTLTIENKIDSGEHDEQTRRYFDYIERNYKKCINLFFFLKPEYNCSKCDCNEFITITYKELESFIEDKGDGKIADFKNHIKKYFVEVNMGNTDIEILRNYRDIKRVYEKAKTAYRTEQKKLNSYMLSHIERKFMGKWETQVVENEGSYRFYKKEWWHDDKKDSSNRCYFYVELLYEDDCPDRICVRCCVKKYSTANESIVIKFLNANPNFKFDVINNDDIIELYKMDFNPENCEINSEEWNDKLKIFAENYIDEAINKMDEVFSLFNKYIEDFET